MCQVGAVWAPWMERKPEPLPQNGKWYWVKYEGLGKTYEAPAMYRADARAFYSVEFSGVPEHSVLVLKEA